MNITLNEAISIHAKASRAWFGTGAARKTQDHIERLRKIGDLEGIEVWEGVKRRIDELDRKLSDNAIGEPTAATRQKEPCRYIQRQGKEEGVFA